MAVATTPAWCKFVPHFVRGLLLQAEQQVPESDEYDREWSAVPTDARTLPAQGIGPLSVVGNVEGINQVGPVTIHGDVSGAVEMKVGWLADFYTQLSLFVLSLACYLISIGFCVCVVVTIIYLCCVAHDTGRAHCALTALSMRVVCT
jgi:hypothetical protein